MSKKTHRKSAGKEAPRARREKASSPVPGREKAIASHVPGATYRLQFNRQFTFAQAAAIADYLREL
ncbi:MAG TPA: hypothetical protein VNT26_08950, partial [Candidatus Sulfotelmatobacter sp.]|nr:hypothetical protein [Candidatus Sulfotelmatobacter sp.]